MSIADELLYAANAGVKMISITTPERERFYTALSTFVAEEMDQNLEAEYERMILIRAGEKFGWYDVDSNKIHTTMSSSHVNDDLWDIMVCQQDDDKLTIGSPEEADNLKPMIASYMNTKQTDGRGNIFKTCLVIEDADMKHYTEHELNPYDYWLPEVRDRGEDLETELKQAQDFAWSPCIDYISPRPS